MTGSEKNGNGTAEFKGLLNDRISWDGCMDKKERLTTRNGIKEKVSDFLSMIWDSKIEFRKVSYMTRFMFINNL